MDLHDDEPLSVIDKGLPERAFGLTTAEFLATAPTLDEFWTPLVVLDDEAMSHNIALMAAWVAAHGLELMPHGKTTMAPALWRRQLDAGATGITLATMGQVRIGYAAGLRSIMLANAVTDPRALAALADLVRDPELRLTCWVDSVATVELMQRRLAASGARTAVDVCVELGADGGRTGARTIAEGVEIARAVADADHLRLAGVAGYEGILGHDRSAAAIEAVTAFLRDLVALHERLSDLYDDGDIVVTAGGSAYFDLVADAFAPHVGADPRVHWTLRSGVYLVHDDGFYRGISPLDDGGTATRRLRSAIHGIGRVVSRPEPDLAIVDGGKRDFSADDGLPIARAVAQQVGGPWHPLAGAEAPRISDQHTFVRDADERITVGAVIALGLSHPCTTFDKWRRIPVIEHRGSTRVVDLVRTYF
ncbi:type III PLP-dependent enzyme domain-containing protein [Microbacterium gorillae]|uniref:hypothetical protein n=1 Tax=Microbacterium gorillae TaxID=1231063 RepID=UPI000693C03B|nr:hypothetical protein [Microbacterium gorillae]